MSLTRVLIVALLAALSGAAQADVLRLREDHPQTYVVRKGDTLWDISEHFLKTPWLWPRLWQANPQVANPHLIYPGDRLQLIWIDGQPRLVNKKVVRLSPQVRIEPRGEPIPTLPLTLVQALLPLDRVMQPGQLEQAPQVLGNSRGQTRVVSRERLFASTVLPPQPAYGIFRPEQIYLEKTSGKPLGQRVDFIATAKVLPARDGELYSQLELSRDLRDVQQGDRILPLPQGEGLDLFFRPALARAGLNGYILDSQSGTRMLSKHDVVFVSLGQRDDLGVGDVLRVYRPGQAVLAEDGELFYRDSAPFSSRLLGGEDYQLPDVAVGELMVFRVYESMALALITRAEDLIKLDYRVSSD